MSVPTPPGWFPDSQDSSLLRWWDGQQWTAHTHPRQPEEPGPAMSHGMTGPSGGSAQVPASPSRDQGGRARPRLFGKGQALDEANAEIDRLQAELVRTGTWDVAQKGAELERLRAEAAKVEAEIAAKRSEGQAEQQRVAADLAKFVNRS